MLKKFRKTDAGFSLIELLVGLAIAGIMFVALSQIITTAAQSLLRMKKQIDMTQKARMALERMTREIASAFHPYGMFAETSGRTDRPWLITRAAGVGGEEMSFVAKMHQKYELDEWRTGASKHKSGDLVEVHYQIKTGADGEKHLYRRISENERLSEAVTNKWAGAGPDVMLAQYVRTLDFSTWDRTGTGPSATYTYNGGAGEELGFPSRVRVIITMYDPDGVVPDMPFGVDVSTMRNTAAYVWP